MNNFVNDTVLFVETEVFQGPLELLLELIEKRKLLINEVSLAKIADDFISITSNYPISLKRSSDFVFIASTLILIKARSLLPNFTITKQEEDDINELQERLKALKILKDSIKKIEKTPLLKPKKSQPLPRTLVFPRDMKIVNLYNAIVELLKDYQVFTIPKVKVRNKISLKDATKTLQKIISNNQKFRFKEIIKSKDKFESVTYFLAILELVRQEVIDINYIFENDFEIVSNNIDTPYYL